MYIHVWYVCMCDISYAHWPCGQQPAKSPGPAEVSSGVLTHIFSVLFFCGSPNSTGPNLCIWTHSIHQEYKCTHTHMQHIQYIPTRTNIIINSNQKQQFSLFRYDRCLLTYRSAKASCRYQWELININFIKLTENLDR